MKTKIIEATNGPANWGKFMLGIFDEEWDYRSQVSGYKVRLLQDRGWSDKHVLVLDLQTGEGGVFLLGGWAKQDLDKHRIWVCPLFEPFLEWLYEQSKSKSTDDLLSLPPHVDLPDAPFAFSGYRRPGPKGEQP